MNHEGRAGSPLPAALTRLPEREPREAGAQRSARPTAPVQGPSACSLFEEPAHRRPTHRLRPTPRAVALLALLCTAALAPSPAAEWKSGAGFRSLELPTPTRNPVGFTSIPPTSSGITFTNVLDELTGAANRVLYNGAGVATGDFDGDGRPDIFFCDLSGHNALYRNLGNLRFEDVTRAAGLAEPLPATRGAVFADINGDGHLDLLMSVTGRGVLCFLNDGHGKFTDATAAAGTAARTGSTTLALADVDGDGTLDLYVTNYRPDDIRDRGRVNMQMVNGRPVLRGSEPNRFILLNGRLEECGQPDQLYLNDGAGHFHAVPWTGGAFLDENGTPLTEPPPDWGLTATFRDINGDGAPDLYVCNDYWTPDRCWINDGHGHFRALPGPALRKTPASSMGVDFSDIDRDGHLDFVVVDMISRYPQMRKRQGFAQMPRPAPIGLDDERRQVMRNTLLLARGDGTYAEIAAFANLAATDWSWSPIFLDVDLDGYDDLLIGAGHFRDVQDYDAEARVQSMQHAWTGSATDADRQRAFTRELMEHYRLYPKLDLPIGAFRNHRDSTFQETTAAWGLDARGVHQGLALADLDGDGLPDLVVNNLNGPASVFHHNGPANRVAVRLVGRTPNTQAIGAKITLSGGAIPFQTTEVICGGRYQSGSDPTVTFATGTSTSAMSLRVQWRNGNVSTVDDVTPNRFFEITEPAHAEGRAPSQPKTTNVIPSPALFEDATASLAHIHPEMAFNDEERQPLLPFRLSQPGPGVAWLDLDGDGLEDLVIGSGRGGALSLFLNKGSGRFRAIKPNAVEPLPDDSAGLVAWSDGHGADRVIAAITGYEASIPSGLLLASVNPTNSPSATLSALATGSAGAGALALGDPFGDGHLVLFAAGGVQPGQYPVASPSRLFRCDGKTWAADTRNNALLDNLGIVNGAVWSDLDGDGFPELVLACEWGPIRVFRFRDGTLAQTTKEWGLDVMTGWWRGVTAVDLDNDGRMDLVASNWGLNSPYRASPQQPLTFAYGQLAQPGVIDIVESEFVDGSLAPSRQMPALARSLPFLLERFATHTAYSEATLAEVLGDRAPLSRRVAAVELRSMAFLNTGNGFKAVELPRDAQFAPAFGVATADLDGDGFEDVFLAQNFSAVNPETSTLNAGLGLWLRGDGTGHFTSASPTQSGIRMTGDQRGAAICDFDGDGRADLVVGQNGAPTRLFHNRAGTPGLRVRLEGTTGNPHGLGAILRLHFGDRMGPAREVHGGSGYWSHDSVVQVLALPAPATRLSVRWPGGKTTDVVLPSSARDIVVDAAGKLRVLR